MTHLIEHNVREETLNVTLSDETKLKSPCRHDGWTWEGTDAFSDMLRMIEEKLEEVAMRVGK